MEEIEKKITTTVKDSAKKHINPRTGLIEQGPSAMGTTITHNDTNGALPTPENQYRIPATSNINGFQSESMVNGRLNISLKNDNKMDEYDTRNGNILQPSTSNGYQNRSSPSKRLLDNTMHPHQINSKPSNYTNNSIMDSGYGSLDKLGSTGGGGGGSSTHNRVYSPILTKRSSIKSTKHSDYLHKSDHKTMLPPNPNGLHTDDDEDDVEDRGSSGFVHMVGRAGSMKDTAYDRLKANKK